MTDAEVRAVQLVAARLQEEYLSNRDFMNREDADDLARKLVAVICEEFMLYDGNRTTPGDEELRKLRADNHLLRKNARVLVEVLADAWWVKAADALQSLDDLTCE